MAIQVQVSNRVINRVSPMMFGENMDWRGDGFLTWNADTRALDEGIVEAFAQSGITTLRYPGGTNASYFHWQETIGPDRKKQIDYFSRNWPTFTQVPGVRYKPNFGWEEFLELCERTGITPSIILNVASGTPREAADWVHDCLKRGVRLTAVDVGNEECYTNTPLPGMDAFTPPEKYIAFYQEFYDIMKAELTEEQFAALHMGAIGNPFCVLPEWDQRILEALGSKMRYLDVHIGYTGIFAARDLPERTYIRSYMASAEFVRRNLEKVKEKIRQYGGENHQDITIHMTEMGPMGGPHWRSLAGALFQADLFNVLLREPLMTAANHLPCLTSPAAGDLIGMVTYPWIDRDDGKFFWKNPISYIFTMFASLTGQQVLDVSVEADTFDSEPMGVTPDIHDVCLGDAGAYLDSDGVLTLMIMNRDSEASQTFTMELFGCYQFLDCTQMYNENPLAFNSWDHPDDVMPAALTADQIQMDGRTMTITCPRVSLTMVRLAPAAVPACGRAKETGG